MNNSSESTPENYGYSWKKKNIYDPVTKTILATKFTIHTHLNPDRYYYKHDTPSQYFAGGSCGNVLTILSYLGWQTYPIARLRNDKAGSILIQDLKQFAVNINLISLLDDGSTPIIIHRVLQDKLGNPKHRFEFRDPASGKYLPSYKPVLSSSVTEIMEQKPISRVLYLDRVSRASIDTAKKSKGEGTWVFFEPSSIKVDKQAIECLLYADIVKFSHDRIKNYAKLFPVCQRKLEVMTLGAQGLQYRTFGQDKWKHLPAFNISQVVDAAGSGDWCTAGIIFKLLKKTCIMIPNLRTLKMH